MRNLFGVSLLVIALPLAGCDHTPRNGEGVGDETIVNEEGVGDDTVFTGEAFAPEQEISSDSGLGAPLGVIRVEGFVGVRRIGSVGREPGGAFARDGAFDALFQEGVELDGFDASGMRVAHGIGHLDPSGDWSFVWSRSFDADV